MLKMPRITAAEPIIHCVLKIQWDDGYAGIVDLRPVIARGKVFTYLQEPKNFEKLKIGEYGHGIVWVNDQGEEIDFGADSLRQRAEKQDRSLGRGAVRKFMSKDLDVVAHLKTRIARLEIRLAEIQERTDEQFNQLIELVNSGFRSLHDQVQSLERS